MTRLRAKSSGGATVDSVGYSPVSQHLREIAERPETWIVVARNLVPVAGVYGFGWSAALTVFNYWFDGLTALAAIGAVLIPRALCETQPKLRAPKSALLNLARGVVAWIFFVSVVGLPYWIALIPLHALLFSETLRHELAHAPALWFTFSSIAASISGKLCNPATLQCPTQS